MIGALTQGAKDLQELRDSWSHLIEVCPPHPLIFKKLINVTRLSPRQRKQGLFHLHPIA